MDRTRSGEKLAYTVAEAAALLSLSRSLMYELINARKIGTVKIGRARRITRGQLDSFLSELAQDDQ
ncbi:MAG: helix-turn-helix domain-containing protein [Fimbriimonas sp.]